MSLRQHNCVGEVRHFDFSALRTLRCEDIKTGGEQLFRSVVVTESTMVEL